MTDDTISANPAIPLAFDRRVEKPPIVDPTLSKNMMIIGAHLSLAMALTNKMPGKVAQDTGLSDDMIRQLRLGEQPDVGVRSLHVLAANLGCPFRVEVGLPGMPLAGTTPAPTNAQADGDD